MPDPRKMQINLTGFLNGKYARVFMGELWAMLDSAQNSDTGIPEELLTAKMEELKDKKSEDVKLKESLRKLADSMGAEAQRQEKDEDESGGSQSVKKTSSSELPKRSSSLRMFSVFSSSSENLKKQ